MEPSNRAALTYYKGFVKALEKINEINPNEKKAAYQNQLQVMEQALRNIKKIDPGYDVSYLENQLSELTDTVQGQAKEKGLRQELELLDNEFNSLENYNNQSNSPVENIEETVRLSTLYVEKKIGLFRTKYPDYNLSEFDARLENFKSHYKEKLLNARTATNNHLNLREQLSKLLLLPELYFSQILTEKEKEIYDDAHLNYLTREDVIPEAEVIDRFESILQERKHAIDEFLNSAESANLGASSGLSHNNNRSFETIGLNSLMNDVRNRYKHIHEFKTTALKSLELTKDFRVEDYYNLRLKDVIIDGASRIFPSESFFQEARMIYKELVDLYGSVQDYKKRVLSNKAKDEERVYMPRAATSNLEMDDSTRQAVQDQGWTDSILKIVQLNSEYYFEKIDRATFRVFNAAVATKSSSGSCTLHEITIHQEFLGFKYGSPKIVNHKTQPIEEEYVYR